MTDWSISGGVPPKFWLGSGVRLKSVPRYIGVVYGIEWRDKEEWLHGGWWYRVRWNGRDSVMGITEGSLEAMP